MKVRIAGIVSESCVDGSGIRLAVFMQGCLRKCCGCHNPDTHDLLGGRILDTADIIEQVRKNPLLSGITLTGGEPFLQIRPALELAKAVKDLGLNVWCYSGYKFEDIKQEHLQYIDVLVDGAYIEELRDLDLQFRGSSNQRIIDVQKSLSARKIILWSDSISQ